MKIMRYIMVNLMPVEAPIVAKPTNAAPGSRVAPNRRTALSGPSLLRSAPQVAPFCSRRNRTLGRFHCFLGRLRECCTNSRTTSARTSSRLASRCRSSSILGLTPAEGVRRSRY